MHPGQQQLRGFALGTLAEDEAGSVIEHVATCQMCEETLNDLEDAADDLLEDLKRPMADSAFEREPGCRQMLDRVRQIAPATVIEDPHAPTVAVAKLGELGQYKLLARLGQGGMGAVYKALHTRLRRVVALKVLPAERMKDQAAVARFDREMQAVGKLNHPNIVAAHDAGEVGGTHYLVMELVDGVDLATLSQRLGPLDMADACELIRQAAVGLAHAHRRGLVHRDIKPSNLMLAQTEEGQPIVKVLDLGLALLAGGHASAKGELTSTGQMMGTLDYMSPEQGNDTHNVDIRTDIYSLGATLHKLLCGEPPFSGPQYNTPGKMIVALATETPPSIGQRRADLPAELIAVVDRMLARDVEKRYASPGEVAEALARFCGPANLRALLDASIDPEPVAEAAEAGTFRAVGAFETSPIVVSEPVATRPVGVQASACNSLKAGLQRESSLKAEVQRSNAGIPRPLLIAAALGGVLLLGVVLTISMGKGTVVVEGPSGGDLPDDVKIVLNSGGKEIVLSSENNWRISVAPGSYQVELQGGNDALEVKKDQISVQRFGQQVVKITRHDEMNTVTTVHEPPQQGPALQQSLPKREMPNVAGMWKIKEAANLIGEAYGGTVEVRVSSTGVVDLDWRDERSKRVVQTGIGLIEDGHLLAAWGATPSYGFCLYKLGPDGTMSARWTVAGAGGRLATERATGGKPGKFEGSYTIRGTAFQTGGEYSGTLSIAKLGETYGVTWDVPEGAYHGVGLRHGDYLAIAWSVENVAAYGSVDYKLEGDTAQGRWTMINQDKLSYEILQRQRK